MSANGVLFSPPRNLHLDETGRAYGEPVELDPDCITAVYVGAAMAEHVAIGFVDLLKDKCPNTKLWRMVRGRHGFGLTAIPFPFSTRELTVGELASMRSKTTTVK